MTEPHTGEETCVCEMCSLNLPFELPAVLLDDCRAERLALFVGAGVSTESKTVLPETFFEGICESLGLDPADAPSFPDVMSLFAQQPNGRRQLVRRIRDRLAHVDSFSELRLRATRFHRELSTIHQIDHIVTTNWDNYFERECGATPFVSPEDFAFWDVPGRKVFKIHGSVDSYGSVVATRQEYEECYERLVSGVLGANLRLTLATKTVVFIGFSFNDDDFRRIHDALTREMHSLRPQAYIVTPNRISDERLRELGLVPIYTDGTFFLKRLKAALVDRGDMLPDSVYEGVSALGPRVVELHDDCSAIDLQRYPEAVFTLFYQDGLKHALDRILMLRHTGYYSHTCNPRNTVLSYEQSRKKALSARNFLDAAYIEGYMNGLIFFLAPAAGRKVLPLFFLHGHRGHIGSLAAFKRLLKTAPNLHRGASKQARRLVGKGYGRATGLVPHHPPWL